MIDFFLLATLFCQPFEKVEHDYLMCVKTYYVCISQTAVKPDIEEEQAVMMCLDSRLAFLFREYQKQQQKQKPGPRK